MEVHDTVQEGVIKTIPKKKKCKKAKWLSEETIQIAEQRREAKGRGEKERYTHLNSEFQRIARDRRKSSSVTNAKKWRKTIEWERLEITSRKLELSREVFMQRWAQKKIEMVWTYERQTILRRGGKNTQKNYLHVYEELSSKKSS